MQFDQNPTDRKIRELLKEKDKSLNDQLKKKMELREEQLKAYLQKSQAPISEDPTVVKRNAVTPMTMNLRELSGQAFTPFRVFWHYYSTFWKKQFSTIEQRYVQQACRKHLYKQVAIGWIICLPITTLTTFIYRKQIPFYIHLYGLATGLFSGLVLGLINSTQANIQRFEQLGTNYQISRQVLIESEKLRMDTPRGLTATQ